MKKSASLLSTPLDQSPHFHSSSIPLPDFFSKYKSDTFTSQPKTLQSLPKRLQNMNQAPQDVA